MSHESLTTHIRSALLLLALCVSMSVVQSSAQQACTCATPDRTVQLQICFEGANRIVDVLACMEGFCPAAPYAHPCATQPINARTVIKRICPVGGWSTSNIENLVHAVTNNLGICCATGTQLPACPGPDYYWIVSYGRCWQEDPGTNCWAPCPGNIPCCTQLVHFRTNFPILGQCFTEVLSTCDEGNQCPPGPDCRPVGCVFPTSPECCF